MYINIYFNTFCYSCSADGAVNNHICLKCGKEFATNADLTRHIQREDTINVITCEVCGATALDKTRMRDHMDTHEGVRRHMCDIIFIMWQSTSL